MRKKSQMRARTVMNRLDRVCRGALYSLLLRVSEFDLVRTEFSYVDHAVFED